MEDKQFDELFELDDETMDDSKIRRLMNWKINKKAIKIACIACLVVFSISTIHKTIIKNREYNPFKEDMSILCGMNAYSYSCADRIQELLIQTYVNVTNPGMYYIGGNSIDDLGNGYYELKGKLAYLFDGVNENQLIPYQITKSKNRLFINSETYYYQNYFNENEEQLNLYEEKQREEMIQELNSLSDSSQFEIWVTYKESISLNKWNAKHIPNYQYIYALSNLNNKLGFSLYNYGKYEKVNETYPNYELNGEFKNWTSSDLYEHYYANLMILNTHQDFLKTVPGIYNIEEELEKVENKQIEIKGYVAFVSKSEALEIIKDKNSAYVKIVDAKISNFNRN